MTQKETQNIWGKLSDMCFWSMIVSFFFVVFLTAVGLPFSHDLFFTLISSLFGLTILFIILNIRKESAIINQKIKQFEYLPEGLYTITDVLTEQEVGTLSNIHVDFLRKKFLEQGMDDNYFYFLPELLEMFIDAEDPDEKLADFLRQSIEGKEDIELFWQRHQSENLTKAH